MSFIEFIIPTFDRLDSLNSILASLVAQTDKDWSALVVYDGVPVKIAETKDIRIRYISTFPNRYNDFGHTPREIGKNQSRGVFTVMTGDDNYYIPTFVEEFKKVFSQSSDTELILCNMVHSHYDYQPFVSYPAYNQIDIGNFAMLTSIAKTIKLNTSFAADGEFIEDYKKLKGTEKIKKIEKYLYVHN